MRAVIARLGDAGKWHIVSAESVTKREVYTSCSLTLADVVSSVREVRVETSSGEPTCRHCLRWQRKAGLSE